MQAKLDQASRLVSSEREHLMLEFSREVNAGRIAAECELERRTQILAAQLRAAEVTIAAERAERMRVESQLFFTPLLRPSGVACLLNLECRRLTLSTPLSPHPSHHPNGQ